LHTVKPWLSRSESFLSWKIVRFSDAKSVLRSKIAAASVAKDTKPVSCENTVFARDAFCRQRIAPLPALGVAGRAADSSVCRAEKMCDFFEKTF
jgi:hypothetical protein